MTIDSAKRNLLNEIGTVLRKYEHSNGGMIGCLIVLPDETNNMFHEWMGESDNWNVIHVDDVPDQYTYPEEEE